MLQLVFCYKIQGQRESFFVCLSIVTPTSNSHLLGLSQWVSVAYLVVQMPENTEANPMMIPIDHANKIITPVLQNVFRFFEKIYEVYRVKDRPYLVEKRLLNNGIISKKEKKLNKEIFLKIFSFQRLLVDLSILTAQR